MNKWNKKRVFVSGGAGVIGTVLVQELLEYGATVLIGDLKPVPKHWKELQYREGDLISLTSTEVQNFNPEVFVHLAATFERSEETEGFWQENYHHNIALSHHLMSLLKDLPSLKQVIFASSYLVYDPFLYLFPKPQKSPIVLKENDRIAPRNLCGMAKLLHEQELKFINTFRPNLQTISARIFRSYGKNSRDIISRWIRSALKNETITVFRPEGIFDYVYAEDVAKALLALSDTTNNGVVNIGSGKARQVKDVVHILKDHFPHLNIKTEESNIPFEASQADMHHFQQLIKQPFHFRPLEETIPELIAFERTCSGPGHL